MKLPFVPTPADVLAAADGVRRAVAEAMALVPRLTSVIGDVEQLLERVSGVVSRVSEIVERVDATVSGVADTRAAAEAAIAGVTATQVTADRTIAGAGKTVESAGMVLAAAEGLVARVQPLVDTYRAPLTALAPSVARLAEAFDPHEVEALVQLIDRLPTVLTHLDEDILPVLGSLGGVAPDVHDLLDIVQDLREVVKGFPGSKLFRRRGADEIAQEEAEDDGESSEGRAAG